MLLTFIPSPLGRESRQAPVIIGDFTPGGVEAGSRCSLWCQGRQTSQPKPQGNLPRELASSEPELEPFIAACYS